MSLNVVTSDDAALVQQLARLGVRHLRVYRSAGEAAPIDPAALIGALASHVEPRFREALIPLFICHPEFAVYVQKIVASLEPQAALTLRHMYTAAVYLQRFWLTALRLYLGDFLLLPDYFGDSWFHLPDASVAFGEAGLRALARLFESEGSAYYTGTDWLSAYQATMALLLAQLKLQQHHVQPNG